MCDQAGCLIAISTTFIPGNWFSVSNYNKEDVRTF